MTFATKDSVKRPHYAWFIMICCLVVMVADVGIIANTVGVFMQPVSAALGISYSEFALNMSIMVIILALAMPLAQKALMAKNIRLYITGAITLECLAFGLQSIYTSIIGWYFSSALIGFSQSLLSFILVPHMIHTWFASNQGTAMGLAFCGTTIGGALFQPIAGFMITEVGYQVTYLLLAGIAWILSVPLVLLIIRDTPADKNLARYGESEIVAGEMAVTPQSNDIDFKKALRSPNFYLTILFVVALIIPINFSNQFTAFAFSLGFPLSLSALMSAAVMVSGVISDPITGFLNDRVSPRFGISISIIAGIVGLILLVVTPFGAVGIFIAAFCFGLDLGLANMAPPLLTRKVFGIKDFNRIYSIVAITIPLTGAVMSLVYSGIYDSTGSYIGGLILALGVDFLALFLCWYLLRKKKTTRKADASIEQLHR